MHELYRQLFKFFHFYWIIHSYKINILHLLRSIYFHIFIYFHHIGFLNFLCFMIIYYKCCLSFFQNYYFLIGMVMHWFFLLYFQCRLETVAFLKLWPCWNTCGFEPFELPPSTRNLIYPLMLSRVVKLFFDSQR